MNVIYGTGGSMWLRMCVCVCVCVSVRKQKSIKMTLVGTATTPCT